MRELLGFGAVVCMLGTAASLIVEPNLLDGAPVIVWIVVVAMAIHAVFLVGMAVWLWVIEPFLERRASAEEPGGPKA